VLMQQPRKGGFLMLPMILLVATASSSPDYAEERARLFYRLAGAAYCPDPMLSNWSCAPCIAANVTMVAIKPCETYWGRAYVARFAGIDSAADAVVVSIRGTNDPQDVMQDLMFAKTDRNMSCPGCQVHTGFYDAWSSIHDPVITEVRQLLASSPPGTPLYVTGHSLGGAIAVIATYDMQNSLGLHVSEAFTFGEPRVGNAEFAHHFGRAPVTWRVTHFKDPVPHLPGRFLGFEHHATEIFYDEPSTSHVVCDGSGEDPKCSTGVSFDPLSISDHLVYFDELVGAC